MPTRHSAVTCFVASFALAACSASQQREADDGPRYSEPGTKLGELALSAEDSAELATLEQQLSTLAPLTTPELLAKRTPSYGPALGYEPSQAGNLPLIQASALALNDAELAKLSAQGFVIAPRRAFPNMAYGYKTIYGLDLPVFISLDAILETVHLSYDAILKQVELTYLSSELKRMFIEARGSLRDGAVADAQTAQDLDLYFAVGLALLEGSDAAPVAGADAKQINALVSAATDAKGIIGVELFGAARYVDFSQFEPRGHYADYEQLQRYFRASMWLGRTEFRLIETLPDGQRVFRRRQLQAALALRDALHAGAREAFDHVDQVISAFVGEHDYMQLAELDALVEKLGGSIADLTDQQIAAIIVEQGYGMQRIASKVIFQLPGLKNLPLDRSFALLGQRYTVDSHVFSSVVYDRVEARYLPDPLDVAYAALGNGAALPLLEPGLAQYEYAPELERIRTLVDAHGADYWDKNLYNLWLSSLRAASPSKDLAAQFASGLPAVAASEAWQRRLLNTQLASWAELRHDTILYVKQSYTSGNSCAFPDGYVDPYPEAFERLRLYALKGQEVAALLPNAGNQYGTGERVKAYFGELARVTATLRDMAQYERAGTPFNDEQMAFLNDAVTSQSQGCGGPQSYQGWYGKLLFDSSEEEMDPTIADVHTDPGGTRQPKVLHVATGLPRLMVMTANSCEGPRAYAGVASAYHEVITGLDRMTDSEWAPKAKSADDVAWMKPILP